MRRHGRGRIDLASRRPSAWLVLASLLASVPTARAGEIEKLLMPGPVIRGHADVEGDCGRCHVAFQAESQDALCRECHKDVGEDIRESTGFHGRAAGVANVRCCACHPEHKGRDANVLGLDRAAFDHEITDHPLRGVHLGVACEACHPLGSRFREAPSQCAECHRDDDVHKGGLGPDCAACHTEKAWLQAKFDHDRTRFALEGKHRDVQCSLCHANEHYKDTPTDCATCHRADDRHLGRFGKRCETCHSSRGWKDARFDHGRDTHFPLRGRHRRATCESCHPRNLYGEKLATDCASCHRADDAHRGRNGTDCERCHREDSWASDVFDHERMAKFPLRGAHGSVKCERCHVRGVKQKIQKACHACHARDDVHRGQQGTACERCHNERAWPADVFFEHDITRFPLLGLHAVVACEQCHKTTRFKDAPLACVECHAADDVHAGRLGSSCAVCHTPNGWNRWQFDHDEQTSFPLRGAHEALGCHACHRTRVEREIDLSKSCGSCHSHDDTHSGAFGRNCERCHGDVSWQEVDLIR